MKNEQANCPTCSKPLKGRGKCRSYNHAAIGPRKVGGVYFNGYWGIEYTVLAVNDPAEGCFSITDKSLTGINNDPRYIGEVHTHATAWDYRRDRVISQPLAEVA
jgi:hypothetical protein